MGNQSAKAVRILVTGGSGFLGSHLCERLLAQGNSVVCVDNLISGSVTNLEHLRSNPCFEFVLHDIVNPLEIEADRIYNLACPASPPHYQRDPILTTRINVVGSLNMLELARRTGARILQASTSEVYGDPETHPQPETYWGNVDPIGPRSCYDEGKRCAESLFFDYRRQYGVDSRVVRIFNTYGSRMQPDDGRVVSCFIVQALKGEDLTVHGDGSQTRSFCYVDDLIEIMIRVMDGEAGDPGPFNIGNPRESTVLELAAKIIELTGSRSAIAFRPLPTGDPKRRRPDIQRVQATFGWSPSIDLDTGLRRTIDYFRTIV